MKRSVSNPNRSLRRRSFRGWLKRVTLPGSPKKIGSDEKGFVFGVPLTSSIRYAKTSVGYVDEDGVKHSRAGSIPIVVAKCGSFLKQQGLETEGIFRVSGSIKRVNELEFSFDSSASHYGLDFSWEGYTVHDAANLLTRYLNKLPNSVIPFESYHDFRDTISNKAYTDTELKVEHFQSLIRKLPIAHQHLLLYLLDLLSLFASNSEQTKMSISNLAAIFCPSLIRHPNYNSPDEYKISQCAIEFLIEYQSLFTMQVLNRKVKVSSPETLIHTSIFRDIPVAKDTIPLSPSPDITSPKLATYVVEPKQILAVMAVFMFLYETYLFFALHFMVEPLTVIAGLFSYYVLFSDQDPILVNDTNVWGCQIDEPSGETITQSLKMDDKASVLSSISRYDEEDFNEQEEEEEGDLDWDMDSATLEMYLLQYDQIKKDADLAKKLQYEEQEARDLNNPFIESDYKRDTKIVT